MSRLAAITALRTAFENFATMAQTRFNSFLPRAGGLMTGRLRQAGDSLVSGEYYVGTLSLNSANWYRVLGMGPQPGTHVIRLVIHAGLSGQRTAITITRNNTWHWVDVEREVFSLTAPPSTQPYISEVRVINDGAAGYFFVDVKTTGDVVAQTYQLTVEYINRNFAVLNGFANQGTAAAGHTLAIGNLLHGKYNMLSTEPYYAMHLDGRVTGNLKARDRIQINAATTGAQSLSVRDYDVFDFTLTGNSTSTIANLSVAASEEITIVVRIRQGGTAYTFGWWSGITWLTTAGTASLPEANKVKEYLFSYNTTYGWTGREGAGN